MAALKSVLTLGKKTDVGAAFSKYAERAATTTVKAHLLGQLQQKKNRARNSDHGLEIAKNIISTSGRDTISLDFSYLKLSALPEEISKLNQLEYLDLRYNNLRSFPKPLYNIRNLKSLNISHNCIENLDIDFRRLLSLKALYADHSKIEKLSGYFTSEASLTKLSIAYNKIKELPKEMFELEQLNSLDIGHNMISSLSSSIARLQSLKQLICEENKISDLPSEIGTLTELKRLNLESNKLTELPREISQLKNLERLWLEFNNLPEDLSFLTSPQGIGRALEVKTARRVPKVEKVINKRIKELDIEIPEQLPGIQFGITQDARIGAYGNFYGCTELGQQSSVIIKESLSRCLDNIVASCVSTDAFSLIERATFNLNNAIKRPPEQASVVEIFDCGQRLIRAKSNTCGEIARDLLPEMDETLIEEVNHAIHLYKSLLSNLPSGDELLRVSDVQTSFDNSSDKIEQIVNHLTTKIESNIPPFAAEVPIEIDANLNGPFPEGHPIEIKYSMIFNLASVLGKIIKHPLGQILGGGITGAVLTNSQIGILTTSQISNLIDQSVFFLLENGIVFREFAAIIGTEMNWLVNLLDWLESRKKTNQ